MKPTEAVPGKPYVLKMKKDEENLIFKWLELQDIYSDSIRYLIQKEIAENGLRNLQHFIPSKRTIESMREQLKQGTMPMTYARTEPIESTSFVQNVPTAQISVLQQPSTSSNEAKDNFDYGTNNSLIVKTEPIPSDNVILRNVTQPTSEPKTDADEIKPKKATKSFSNDVLDSYR